MTNKLMWLSEQITSVELVIQFTDATVKARDYHNKPVNSKSIHWHLATQYL